MKSLERKKQIFDLQRQVPYPFVKGDVKIGTYYADFTFRLEPGGEIFVADAKHRETAKGQSWKRTVKMMLGFYGITIHMIFKGESDPEQLVVHLRSGVLN